MIQKTKNCGTYNGKIEIKELVESLNSNKGKIEKLRYAVDERAVFAVDGAV